MNKINTGFILNPLVGSLEEEQYLIRYFTKDRFLQLLVEKSLWFTRTYKWRDMDACEANLIPSYKNYLKKQHTEEAEYNYLKALMEFGLVTDFGCYFSSYENNESDAMWRSYTPAPNYGVAVIIRAKSLSKSINRISHSFRRIFISKIKYLSDTKANKMSVGNTAHSRTKHKELDWDLAECHFYKRDAFAAEKEVRAVLSPNESWVDLFEIYMKEKSIKKFPISTQTPSDQSYYRMDARRSMESVCDTDYSVFLTVTQAKELTVFVEKHGIKYLKYSGYNVPFDVDLIEKVILHPSLVGNTKEIEFYKEYIKNNSAGIKVEESKLYTTSW